MNINFDPSGQLPRSVFARVLATLFWIVALVAALMFSVVIFAGLAIAGLVFWAWFLWKTRAFRRQMEAQRREQGFEASARHPSADGDIIEGESVRLDDERRLLP